MTDYPDVLYTVKDRIGTITLNRPDRLNAYTPAMADGVRRAMAAAAQDGQVRVIVLTGAGRGFCAGADMEVLNATLKGERGSTGNPVAQRRVLRIEEAIAQGLPPREIISKFLKS